MGIRYRLLVQRNVHRVADKNLVTAITGKGPKAPTSPPSRSARHLPIQSPVMLLGDGSGFSPLSTLPMLCSTSWKACQYPLAVLFVNLGIPASAASPLDQRRRDAVAAIDSECQASVT